MDAVPASPGGVYYRQPCDYVTMLVLYLFLELSQLARQLSHQRDGVLQLLLQAAHFILLAVSLAAHQGHGSHAGEPLQVLLLRGQRERGTVNGGGGRRKGPRPKHGAPIQHGRVEKLFITSGELKADSRSRTKASGKCLSLLTTIHSARDSVTSLCCCGFHFANYGQQLKSK